MSAVLQFDRAAAIGRRIRQALLAAGFCRAMAYSLGKSAQIDALRGATMGDCRRKYLKPRTARVFDGPGDAA